MEGRPPAMEGSCDYLNKQSRTKEKGVFLWHGAKTPSILKKSKLVTKSHKKPWTWTDSLDKRPKRRNMDMRFGTRNTRNLYRASFLMTVSRELSRYSLDLVGVQEVRWEGSGTKPAGE
jgi:hypothetical protein